MKRNPRIIWVCPNSEYFYRSSGEVQSRLDPILSKLTENGLSIHILLPFDSTLLPKTKIARSRVSSAEVKLKHNFEVEFIKLTRASTLPSIHMVKFPQLDHASSSALLSKSVIPFAQRLRKPIDVIHLFGWQASLLPFFLDEMGPRPPMLQKTKTLLTIKSLLDQGNFSIDTIETLGLPEIVFQPEGFEFFGQFSFLKAGVMLCDVVSLVTPTRSRRTPSSPASRFEKILKWQASKVRIWASDRAYKSYFSAYEELGLLGPSQNTIKPLLQKLSQKQETHQKEMLQHWGPPPPQRYNTNMIALLMQSPRKAFSYWEWTGIDQSLKQYGILLSNISQKQTTVLARGVDTFGEFWFDVIPDQEYMIELVGWTASGEMKVLLQSNRVRTARETPSSNKNAVFIDVRNRKQVTINTMMSWLTPRIKWRGSSLTELETDHQEWELPSSFSSIEVQKP